MAAYVVTCSIIIGAADSPADAAVAAFNVLQAPNTPATTFAVRPLFAPSDSPTHFVNVSNTAGREHPVVPCCYCGAPATALDPYVGGAFCADHSAALVDFPLNQGDE